VVEEELGAGESKSISNDGTSGWEDVEEEDEDLAHLEDVENGHPMEGIEDQAVITVSHCLVLLKILLTVARTFNPSHSSGFKGGGRQLYDPVWGSWRPWNMSMLF
jgi:hypothetical protein